jgi:hypothetical protein
MGKRFKDRFVWSDRVLMITACRTVTRARWTTSTEHCDDAG